MNNVIDMQRWTEGREPEAEFYGYLGGNGRNAISLYRYDGSDQPQIGLATANPHGQEGPQFFLNTEQAVILARLLCETYGFSVLKMTQPPAPPPPPTYYVKMDTPPPTGWTPKQLQDRAETVRSGFYEPHNDDPSR